MKKNISVIFLVALWLTLPSCLVSLRQLATYDTIITNDQFTGSWLQSEKPILIQKLNESLYKNVFAEARESKKPFSTEDSIFASKLYIITSRENEIDYTWVASLVSIGSNTFVSLKPDVSAYRGRDVSPPTSLQGYSFAKLERQTDNALTLRFIDGKFVQEMILSGKARIRHEYDPLFGTFMITASADELRKFLEKYGNDERLFKEGNVVNLIRKN